MLNSQIVGLVRNVWPQSGECRSLPNSLRFRPRNILFFALLILPSCGPVYQTNFIRTPSSAPGFENCLVPCSVQQERCNGKKQAEYRSCTFNAETQYSTCETLASARRALGEKYYCYQRYCSEPDLRPCTDSFNKCYERCGGTVKEETKCVARCDKQ